MSRKIIQRNTEPNRTNAGDGYPRAFLEKGDGITTRMF
jgi:hypothetical protein